MCRLSAAIQWSSFVRLRSPSGTSVQAGPEPRVGQTAAAESADKGQEVVARAKHVRQMGARPPDDPHTPSGAEALAKRVRWYAIDFSAGLAIEIQLRVNCL